jgi:hypothetical protein
MRLPTTLLAILLAVATVGCSPRPSAKSVSPAGPAASANSAATDSPPQVLGSNGRPRRVELPRNPTPLCSKTITTGCRVKPPAGALEPPATDDDDVTYAVARVEMIKEGYDPVRVLKKKEDYVCRYDVLRCRRYPELFTCTYAGAHYCEFLFRRRSDGLYFVVTVFGEITTAEDLKREWVTGVEQATDVDFEDIVIA